MNFRINYQKQDWHKGTFNNEPSMTQPEHGDELEINNIMARYVKTGLMPLNKIAATFQDLSLPHDFDTMQDKILTARQMFIDLPQQVRDEFRTAEELLKAFGTPSGKIRLEALGILNKRQDATPVRPETSESASVPKTKQAVEPQPAS